MIEGRRCACLLSVLALAASTLLISAGVAVGQAPPGIPSSVAVTPGDASAEVTWVAPTDDGGDTISSYTVTVDPGGAVTRVPGVVSTATVTGLSNGVAYRFTVTAANSAGPGPPSAVSNAVRPAPAPGTSGPTLISEDFATSVGGMAPISGGTWGVASGRYVLSAPADDGEDVANANLAVDSTTVDGDFTLTASASTTGTDSPFNDFSVVFGFQDPANYYFASFSESNDDNTSGLFKVVGGTRTQLADITEPIVAGAVYPVRVERQGATIRVYLAGEQVASAGDTTFPGGRVGFGSRNDGGTFDDLVVTGPLPPSAPATRPGFFARLWTRLTSLFSG